MSAAANRRGPLGWLRRHRGVRIALLAAIVGVVLWTVAGAVTLFVAGTRVGDARSELGGIQRRVDVESVLDGSAERRLRDLRGDLVAVQDAVDSPLVLPLRVLPGVGRQVRSADALGDAGVDAVDLGLGAVGDLRAALDAPASTGPERLALVDRVTGIIERSRAGLDRISLGPSGRLIAELSNARDAGEEALADLESFLDSADAATTAVGAILQGGDQLLIAANNAEMRAGSGMFLQVGTLRSDEGRLDLDELEAAKDIKLPPGAVAADSTTYDDRWGFLQPTEEWRNLAASPRFDVTAELATRMWEGLGNPRPAGAVLVDPFALSAILRATGPVEVDGRSVDADGVIDLLLHDQYDVFADLTREEVESTQEARREQLGRIADATIEALDGDIDLIELVRGLRDAVAGRHLMAWSSDPEVQDGWIAAGMSGTLDPDALAVSLLNRGANKLDPFVRVVADASFTERPDGAVEATVDLEVRNRVGPDEVRYVAGPASGVDGVRTYGQYAGYLAVVLPEGATNARIEGVEGFEVLGDDGSFPTLATRFVVDRGADVEYRLTFLLPRGTSTVEIQPSARPEPIRWRVDGSRFDDGGSHRVWIGED